MINTKNYNIPNKVITKTPPNATLEPLYTYLLLSLVFTILVAPNKQLFNIKLLIRFIGQVSNS